ncbi:long-chain acyl-CoA synthetase [Fluviicoccus keumensis]|uniref:Long-chain acyl-CoA synthetase n=1 Tax=Fluviicoccus keumensis TaxID=1435465 RepID=A0A4Q7YJY5_9GAMM|nr:AMP-binding protein [Fluviicoccus keumensis]RZU36789.1 long-chain acyl-CoA synthetase [Fluviicoccus keumensis]
MSRLKLLASGEARLAAGAVIGQMGASRLARNLLGAAWRHHRKNSGLGREFFLGFWESLGTREAVIDGKRRLSFLAFRERVLRVVDALHTLGLREGDACAVLLQNGAEWFEINQACNLSGIIMPMLNWHLKPVELAQCIQRANAKVVVVDADFLDRVLAVRDQLTTVSHILVVGSQDAPSGTLAYERLLADALPRLRPGTFHLSAKAYSGGTTGTPKFINLDQAAMFGETDSARRGASRDEALRMALGQLSALGWYGLGDLHDAQSGNARSLVPGPLYHAGVQVAVLPFLFGGTVVPMRKFTAEAFLQMIEAERISWTFVAPTMLERVLALPDEVRQRYDLSSMRTLICAAAPCPAPVKIAINALFQKQGAPRDVFHEYYGASETGIITILLPGDYARHPERYRSVGKVRAAQCRIYDAATGSWAACGVEGKVLVRSALTFGLQYVGEQKKTDDCFIEVEGQLWYDDGLIGYLDSDDFLYLTSREKEMIITGGVNLFPNEIEEVIKRHPDVLDVAVVRAPDPDLGEVPAAVVELREDAASVTAEDILAHCREQGLYGFKVPRRVEFGHLPRNLAGKLPKKQLEAAFWKGVERIG